MKMKKYLFLILAATLFAACGGDDDDVINGSKPIKSSVSGFADYASWVGKDFSMIKSQLNDPVNIKKNSPAYGYTSYYYENLDDGNTTSLYIDVNNETDKVISLSQKLANNVFLAEDIINYFGENYYCYEDDSGSYTFGNKSISEECTIGIILTVRGRISIYYWDIVESHNMY